MPGQDGTGPYGTYKDCVPQEDDFFGRGYFCRGRCFSRDGNSRYNPRGELRPRFLGTQEDSTNSNLSKEQEITFLESRKEVLNQNLEGIEKRIKTLKEKAKTAK